MTVTCPNCKTTYNLPDDKARLGVKLRCTVCKQVFVLPDPSAPADGEKKGPLSDAPSSGLLGGEGELRISIGSETKKKKKKKKSGLTIFLLIFLVLCAGAGAAWRFTNWLDPLKAMVGMAPAHEMTEEERAALQAEQVKQLEMRNVRQYTVPNEKIGKITVIEGKVANVSDHPRELIRLEASLFDDQGKPLTSKSQLAGTFVSLFQLQVLDKDELERALNNKLDILANNTNIPPGGLVPFMVVLYNPPAEASDFSVKIIDARIPEQNKEEEQKP